MSRIMLVVAATAMLASGPAGAVHDYTCGGTWSTRNSCPFELQGLPLKIYGEASASSGQVSVHVWAVVETPTGDRTIVECRAHGNRAASCREELDIGERIDPFVRTLPMRCWVEGVGGGTYGCSTYVTPS